MHERAIDLSGASILVVDDVPSNLDVLCPIMECLATSTVPVFWMGQM